MFNTIIYKLERNLATLKPTTVVTSKIMDDHSYFLSVLNTLDDNTALQAHKDEISNEINACLELLDTVQAAAPQH